MKLLFVFEFVRPVINIKILVLYLHEEPNLDVVESTTQI